MKKIITKVGALALSVALFMLLSVPTASAATTKLTPGKLYKEATLGWQMKFPKGWAHDPVIEAPIFMYKDVATNNNISVTVEEYKDMDFNGYIDLSRAGLAVLATQGTPYVTQYDKPYKLAGFKKGHKIRGYIMMSPTNKIHSEIVVLDGGKGRAYLITTSTGPKDWKKISALLPSIYKSFKAPISK